MEKKTFSQKFLTNSATLLVTSVFDRLTVLATVPLLTRSFSKEEYGLLDLILGTYFIFRIISSANLIQSVARFVGKYTEDNREKDFFSTLLVFILVNSFFTFGIVAATAHYTNIDQIRLDLLVFWMVTCGFRDYLGAYLKFSGRVLKFVIEQVCYSSLFLICVILLASSNYLNIESFLFCKATLSILSVSINLAINFSSLVCLRLDLSIVKQALKYSTPFVFSSISLIAYQYIDRLMISKILSLSDAGVYSLSLRFAGLFTVVSSAASASIYPLVYKDYKNEKTKSELRKSFFIFSSLGSLIGIFIIFLSWALFRIGFIGSDFSESRTYIAPLVFLSIISSFHVFSPGLNMKGKTWIIMLINTKGLIVAVALNYFLIPILGVSGAVSASIIASIFTQFTLFLLSQKYYNCEIPFLRTIGLIGLLYFFFTVL